MPLLQVEVMWTTIWQQWGVNAANTAINVYSVLLAVTAAWLWRHRKETSLVNAMRMVPVRSLRFNLIVLCLDIAVIGLLCILLSTQMHLMLAGAGLILDSGIYDRLPTLLVAFLVLFLGDFVSYWRHRVEHSHVLWPAHVMHHSDDEMTWWTIYRFHPINRVTTTIIDTGVLLMMGFPVWATLLNNFVRHYYGAFIHMDLPWSYGRLGKWLVSPAMHRWHHVRQGDGMGSNFATVFAVFDRAFGTFHLPGPCKEPLGVTEVPSDSLRTQLLLPFQKWFHFTRTRALNWSRR